MKKNMPVNKLSTPSSTGITGMFFASQPISVLFIEDMSTLINVQNN
jgi:hypothetical protein